ncbi:glycosyltransferase family 2 protein [Candidatus Giovannonibacteria bacterium]|nr:glycosyltransferase family 2 protein [Candidatus Giovannonibacteria bacterium]
MSQPANNKKVIAVILGYNVEKTLEVTFKSIPREWVDDVILVNNASQDRTGEIAKRLNIKTFTNERNMGYGGAQKRGYGEALKMGADAVVMVHGDFQYDPKFIPDVVRPLVFDDFHICIGSRMMDHEKALALGLPYWKFLANIFLTKIENFVLGLALSEYHSGFRAYSRRFLETAPFERNSDNYVFDTEIIVQAKILRFKIKEVPIERRYFKDAAGITFFKSVEYGFMILWAMLKYLFTLFSIRKFRQFDLQN